MGNKLAYLNDTINRVLEYKGIISGETNTRRVMIDPILGCLGYDTSNPYEVSNEYICDFGIKKGEKVDYALFKNAELTILIEAKSVDTELDKSHISQLFRYFSVTNAQVGVLTNGIDYLFFTDTKSKNIMDDEPFFKMCIEDLKDGDLDKLLLFHKEDYNIELVKSIFRNMNIELKVAEYFENQVFNIDLDLTDFIKNRLEIEVNAEDFAKIVQHTLKNTLFSDLSSNNCISDVSNNVKDDYLALCDATSLNCTGFKIYKLLIGDVEYDVKSWSDAIYTLVNHVAVGVSDIEWIDKLDGYTSLDKGFIRKDNRRFLKCCPIGNTGLYLDMHGSSYMHVQRMKVICRNAKLNLNSIMFYLKQ